jgi:hypothetical protein
VLRPTRILLAPICLTAAVLAAGCGGDKALSKADYVKQADQICQRAKDSQKKLGTPNTAADIATFADKAKPTIEDEIKQLRALKAPDELKDDANAAYALLDQEVPKIDELAAAAKANDVPKLQAVVESASKISDQAGVKAKKLGLKVCGGA